MPPETPAPRPSFVAYAIVDISTAPPTFIGAEPTRSECRKKIQWREDADTLRIRRARIITWES